MEDHKRFLRGYLEAERRITLKQAKQSGHADQIAAEMAALEKQRAAVLDAINAVPDPKSRTLLEARYISGMRWRDVARLMGYSVDHIYKLCRRALEQLKI